VAVEFHEAANIFPLDEENLDGLAADIKAHGQQVPIELFDGKIIDGRRRYRACEIAGVKPKTISVSPSDPVAYVLSLNLHRRHLTPSQLAMVGARAREMYDEAAKRRQQASGGDKKSPKAKSVQEKFPEPIHRQARDEVGKVVGVSGKLIDSGTKVLTEAVPELVKAVDEGRLSVSNAAKVAAQPEQMQRAVAEQAKFSGGRYRMPVIEMAPAPDPDTDPEARKSRGKGVALAHQAINLLSQIPKNDGLRKRGFQIVLEWVQRNLRSM
jgi:hypothetical protein